MNIHRQTRLVCALTAAGWCALAGGTAHADPSFKLSGYGTLAATRLDSNDYAFRSTMGQSEGAGRGIDLGVDSKLALQGVTQFGNGLSLTGQLLGQRHRVDGTAESNNDFEVGFEWLYAQYAVTSNLDARVGRVVLPAFMISDSRNVGYSQPWLRAPMVVYAGMPMTNVDGAQLTWRVPVGSAVVSVQPTYGQSSFNLQSGKFVLVDRTKWVGGLNLSVELGDWLLRAGQVRSRTPEADIAPMGAGTPGVSYDMRDKFTTLGLQYDNGSALFMAEWTKRKMNDMPVAGNPVWGFIQIGGGMTFADYYAAKLAGKPLSHADTFYVAGGWRFGSFLPMLAVGQVNDLKYKVKNREVSASIRYDVAPSMALKAQWTQFNARDAQAVVSAALEGSADYNKKLNAVSVGLDFVF